MSERFIAIIDDADGDAEEHYQDWLINGREDIFEIKFYDEDDLSFCFTDYLDSNETPYEITYAGFDSYPTVIIKRERTVMSNTIEELKKKAMADLEALQKVGSALDSLKNQLKGVSIETILAAYIQAEVTKIDSLAKKNKIDFKVDTKELINLVKLPVSHGGLKLSQILPFIPRSYSELEDVNGDEWQLNDLGEWYNTTSWNDSGCEWESSQNC